MAAMTWDRYLQFLMEVEEENIAENYRVGRALNDADEELNLDVRKGFDNLKAVLPMLLAAPDLFVALQKAVQVMQDHDIDEAMAGEFTMFTDALQKAEGVPVG